MVPQQTHYQMSWLKVFEHSWACPFAICYLLFAIPLLSRPTRLAIGYRLLHRTLLTITAFPAFPALTAFLYE
jgi:hypothetical protein